MKKYFVLFGILVVNQFTYAQKNWQLSIQTWTFHRYSFLESVDKADSLGIKYLEVYPGQKVGGDIPGVFSYTLDKEARNKIKQYLKQKDSKVIALGVIDKYYYNRENLEQFFLFCKDMGIAFITAEPEPADLNLFNVFAGRHGIKVALHCHPKPSSHYWHPDSTLAAMKNRENIGAWPDIGHWARNGVDIQVALAKMKGKLWGLHLKDVKEFDNIATEDVLLGEGVCNIPAVLEELKSQKFKGVIAMEYEANENNNMDDLRKNLLFYEMGIDDLKKKKK